MCIHKKVQRRLKFGTFLNATSEKVKKIMLRFQKFSVYFRNRRHLRVQKLTGFVGNKLFFMYTNKDVFLRFFISLSHNQLQQPNKKNSSPEIKDEINAAEKIKTKKSIIKTNKIL